MSVLDSQYGDSGGRFGREQWRDFRGSGLSSSFKDLPDARQQAKVVYPLDEVLLALLATLAGSEAFTDIARFGERKQTRPAVALPPVQAPPAACARPGEGGGKIQ
jgi:hypothetical protein